MRARTVLLLLVLFLGLGGLWLVKQREIERGGPTLDQVPLLPGLEGPRVRALRIDNLERAVQVLLERDAAGRWYLTEPLAYPAQEGVVRSLFSALSAALGEPVRGTPPAQLGLDPPVGVIECTVVGAGDGAPERVLRIEIGGVDLDHDRIFVRVPDHPARAGTGTIFRTVRTLYTAIDRNPDDYRDPRTTPLRPAEVVGLRRSGTLWIAEEGREVDLAFDALAGPEGWMRVAPAVTLDPTAMGLLVRGFTDLRVDRFADDSPRDLAPYGLAEPAFSVELEALAGSPVTLHFGFPPREGRTAVGEHHWFARREGFDHVWELDASDVRLLTRPAALFYDQVALRFARGEVVRLELERDGRRCVVERVEASRLRDGDAVRDARWSVREVGPGAGTETVPSFPADPGAVEETLLALGTLALGEHLPEAAFEPADPPLALAVELSSGARLSGRLGAPVRDPASGAQGRQFLRAGDEVPALAGEEAVELCRTPIDRFRTRHVLRVPESLVRVVELDHDGRTFAFFNGGENVWHVEGTQVGAPRDLVESLDGLLNLGVRRWLAAAPAAERELGVRLVRVQDEPLTFTLALLPDGRATCTTAEGGVAEVDPALVARLLGLFD